MMLTMTLRDSGTTLTFLTAPDARKIRLSVADSDGYEIAVDMNVKQLDGLVKLATIALGTER